MVYQRDSPLFSDVLYWYKKNNWKRLNTLFPLLDENTWIKRKSDSEFFVLLKLAPLKDEILSNLVDPLFVRRAINIRDEDKFKKNNLFSLTEVLYRELQNENKDLQTIVMAYQRDLQNYFPEIKWKPLHWVSGKSDSSMEYELRKEIKELSDKIEKIHDVWKRISGYALEMSYRDWKRAVDNRDKAFLEKWHVELPEIKRGIAIATAGRILAYLRAARGKPGRHPKPFNVFIYHLINKCTKWKIDDNRKYIMRQDGQHCLERDWELIIYLLLDVHVRQARLPEVEKFISKNSRRLAADAMRDLKKKLWDIYKNFPPMEGWPFPRRIPETGFRKLIVDDNGKLRMVRL